MNINVITKVWEWDGIEKFCTVTVTRKWGMPVGIQNMGPTDVDKSLDLGSVSEAMRLI